MMPTFRPGDQVRYKDVFGSDLKCTVTFDDGKDLYITGSDFLPTEDGRTYGVKIRDRGRVQIWSLFTLLEHDLEEIS